MRSLIAAFAMYSRIPMPNIPWDERSRRYALCWFPLIGAVIGGLLLGWYWLCGVLGFPPAVFAAVSVCIPVAVTGGIHLDGFCDAEDARASYASRERRLEIMHDPHIGSFAVMHLVLCLIVQTVCFAQVRDFESAALIALGYVLSRILSALAAVTFRSARREGALQSFAQPAHKRVTLTVLLLLLLLTVIGMHLISLRKAPLLLLTAALLFAHYRAYSYRTFGGITGDLAGWFLVRCELGVLVVVTLTSGI